MAKSRFRAIAGSIGVIAALAFPMVSGLNVASAQQPTVPQFGGATTLAWPPVFSGELQATVGDATVIVGLVGNRTLREHAFVDVRWELPTNVKFVDSYANNQSGGNRNRGKLEGLSASLQQVGWINHYVRAGQVQGPFYIILDNSAGRTFNTHSWLWFSTADQSYRRNGNYVSSGLRAGGAPLSWSAEFGTAASASGLPGGAR